MPCRRNDPPQRKIGQDFSGVYTHGLRNMRVERGFRKRPRRQIAP
ncbi:MAG: hypothetical protein JWP80_2875 [Pseudomonas sp.]|nr:hypothetical protein [Pseudomonas sp.]